MFAPLVPAYAACATSNRQHGGGLACASCNPPVPTSAQPDGRNAGQQRGRGEHDRQSAPPSARAGPCGAGDVLLEFSATDMRCSGGHGAVRARPTRPAAPTTPVS